MASDKKRRKQSAIDRKHKQPSSAGQKPRPKDGDRRHRGVDLARLEQDRKKASQEWNLDVGWTDTPKEPQ